MSGPAKIKLGISSCLLGHEVRFDGGHKRDRYLTDVLSQYFDYVAICPELAIGLGTPRPAIHLFDSIDSPKLVGTKDKTFDVTDDMRSYAARKMHEIPGLAGYILKRGSPSCGMERVKVYDANNIPIGAAQGLFAQTLMRTYPWLPCEEEGRLGDPGLRENFLARVFTYHRWLDIEKEGLSARRIIAFHTAHKFLLLAHSETHYRKLGPMVAEAGKRDPVEFGAEYIEFFMAGLKKMATRRRHVNVLQHLMGFLKRDIDQGDKAELLNVLEQYKNNEIPLIVPLQLLKHHFRRNPDPYVEFQHYLSPHPDELGLRNAI